MDEQIRGLIFQAIDKTISSDDFERLQDALQQSADVRVEYLRVVNLMETLREIAVERHLPTDVSSIESQPRTNVDSQTASALSGRRWKRTMLAIAVLVLVSAVAFRFGQRNVPEGSLQVAGRAIPGKENTKESLLAGHAALRRTVNLKWSAATPVYHEGDVLPDGILQFDSGVAEIDFFCGATLIVEGPAILDVESDWSVKVIEGRLRANVPPAARGFVVRAADAEIVDLGTEFALEVGAENARVEVIDGEVELRGGKHDGSHLLTGQGQSLRGTSPNAGLGELSTGNDIRRLRTVAELERFNEWKSSLQSLSKDERLIAFYPIANSVQDRRVRNLALTGANLDAQLVGPVKRTFGRFGSPSKGLEFDRPGSRVRTRIDGVFQAFTFTSWVKIDSLEHVYNALFMADGYENGEPHWQIQDDGRLMLSVMVDDSTSIHHFSEREQKFVDTAGLARIYYTEPFWNPSQSGQWFHLAAVYDPVGRKVVQYVNGRQLSSEEIADEFHITELRIGAAEIGNWGQPFRNTPWFSVRNLNGTIDELAIYNAVLAAEEIQALYEQGKPLGY